MWVRVSGWMLPLAGMVWVGRSDGEPSGHGGVGCWGLPGRSAVGELLASCWAAGGDVPAGAFFAGVAGGSEFVEDAAGGGGDLAAFA
jgi:hypothetical protein